MSTRRRPGSWQEEVAKGFSRLFSRTASQEKEEESHKTTSSKDSGEEQEKTDRGISRLFLRASSLEKKEGNDKSSTGKEATTEDQAKGQSSSKLFFRKISQENKGESDQATKDEPDKVGVFSRLFTRASSQEKEGTNQDPSSQEEKNSSLTTDNNENLSPHQQTNSDPNSLTTAQNTTSTKEDVEFDLFQDIKGHDSEKQSKDNFLHFIGNLFSFSSKSPGSSSQTVGIQELTKEEVQAEQNLESETLNQEPTLDVCIGDDTQASENGTTSEDKNHSSGIMETSSVITEQEGMLINEEKNHVSIIKETSSKTPKPKDIPTNEDNIHGSAIIETSSVITEPEDTLTNEDKIHVSTSSETPKQEDIPTTKDTTQVSSITEISFVTTNQEEFPINKDKNHVASFPESSPVISKHEHGHPSSDLHKQNPSIQDGPAITYGTYRGSRRIRKLLKRRPDVNSPIPEREETSERDSITPDDGRTDYSALDQSVVLDPHIDLQQNDEDDIPSQKTNMKNQFHTDINENSSLTDDLQTKENAKSIENLQLHVKITENRELNEEGDLETTEVLHSKIHQSSELTNVQELHNVGTSIIIEDILPCNKDTSNITKGQQLTTNEISRNAEKHEQLAEEKAVFAENVLNTSTEEYGKSDTENSQFTLNPMIMKELKPEPTESSVQSDQNTMPTEDNQQQKLNKQPVTKQEATEGLKYEANHQPYVECNTRDNLHINAGGPQLSADDASKTPHLGAISHEGQINVNEIPQNVEHLQPNVGKTSVFSEVVEPHVNENALTRDDLKRSTNNIYFTSEAPQTDVEETSYTGHLHTILRNKISDLNNIPLIPNSNVSTNSLDHSTNNIAEQQLDEKQSAAIIKTHILPQTVVDDSQMKHNSSDDYVKDDGIKYTSIDSYSGRGNDDSVSDGSFPQDFNKSVLDINNDSFCSVSPDKTHKVTDISYDISVSQTDKKSSSQSSSDLTVGVDAVDTLNNNCSLSSGNNSEVKKNDLALSFDNSIDIPSPPLTTMSDSPLTPSVCTGIRNDSPLPHSAGIDSGVVSSQAYTPEENNMAKMSPSDLYDNTRYELLESGNAQENSVSDFIQVDKKGLEERASAAPEFGGNSKLETLPSLEENDVLSISEGMPNSKGVFSNVQMTTTEKGLGNDLTMVRFSSAHYSEDNPTCSINSEDVCVAKVLVKSVDIEEVKIAPTCFQSEVISVSKLDTPRLEPEYVCLPNLSPPPAVTTHENYFQIQRHDPESGSLATFQQHSAELKKERENNNNQNNTFNEYTPENTNQVLCTEKADVDHEPNIAFDLTHGKNVDLEDFSFQPKFEIYEKLDRSPLNFEVKETYLANKNNDTPLITSNSPDVENLKNNNVDTHVTSLKDNFINVVSRQNKSFDENADEGPTFTGSQGEYENLDSLKNYPDVFPNQGVIHTLPKESSDILDRSSLQDNKDISNEANGNCPVSTRMLKKEWNLADNSQPSDEAFIQKADEIIDTVLHTAIKQVQQTHDSNVHQNYKTNQSLVSLSAEEVKLEQGNENDIPNDSVVANKPTTKLQFPKNEDTFESVATEIVNDVILSAKQNLASKQDVLAFNRHDVILCNSLSSVNTALTDLGIENILDGPHSVSSLLEMGNVSSATSCEINSNVLLPLDLPLNHTVTEQKISFLNELSSTGRSNDQGNICPEDVKEDLDNKFFTEMVMMETSLAKTNKSDGTNELEAAYLPSVQIDLHCKGDESQIVNDSYNNQREYPPLSLENTCNEVTADHNSDVPEQSTPSLKTNEEYSSPFDFSVHNGHYIEITESDEEGKDQDNYLNHSEEDTNSDSFLTVQTRRVRIYPLSLSPIYEDDSSTEDVLSNHSSPGQIERRKDEGSNANDHSSILSLLQSVSDRLKQESYSALDNDSPSTNGQLNQTTIEETENPPFPSNHQEDIFNENELKNTAAPSQTSLSSGLFITKSTVPNWPSLSLGRQSFLLQMASQSSIYGSKSAKETLPLQDSKTSSEETDSKVCVSDVTPGSASHLTPMQAPSALQLAPNPNLSIQKSNIELKPRLTSQSIYYQYFHDSQNYVIGTENKESPVQEKLPSFREHSYKDAQALLARPTDSDSIKPNPRPGKVVISDTIDHENKMELKSDILDASSLIFPNGVNVQVIRGCWILYEKPNFQGQAHVLEEGEAVLQHLWHSPESTSKPDKIIIGSVKRIAKDHLPEVVLNPVAGEDNTSISIRTEIRSIHQLVHRTPHTLTVTAGVWLAYTEAQYAGNVSVLEEGCILSPVQECDVWSLRPLKMGGLKVQLPSEPKIILYEKPHFEGWSRELTDHVYSIKTIIYEGEDQDIGSIRVIGGIWVGYEKERYKGLQYLLEEGDYEDWKAWGGFNSTLQSIRYLHAEFLETSITLFESEAGDRKVIDLFNQAVPDLEQAGYTTETQSIHVKKGLWVAYQYKHFCGEQYILEKGRYKSCVDWGGSTNTIMSVRPVLLEPLGKDEPKHLIKAYSLENFQGQCEIFTKETSDFQSFPPRSFKVLRGCWILCYQADASDNVCVLEEGNFPDLVTCGCPASEIKYIKPIDYVFAEPSISLFALDMCEGREMHFEEPVTSVLSKDLNFYTQSIWVRKGLWIVFEGANFLGRQMLLEVGQVLNWTDFSGWRAIGSLRPLKQPAVYFRVKNRHKDKYLTVTGRLTDTRPTFVCVSARNGQSTQIWYFCRGLLKSKANHSCLDVVGGKNMPGSKVSLVTENGQPRQKWRISKDGTITSYISEDLVLDVKGGNFYDQNYTVVNRAQEDEASQKWDIEIL